MWLWPFFLMSHVLGHLSKCPSGRSCGAEGLMRDPEEPAELAWPLPIQSLLMMGYTSACADVTHTIQCEPERGREEDKQAPRARSL